MKAHRNSQRLAVVVVAGIILAACAPPPTPAAPAPTSPPQIVEVTRIVEGTSVVEEIVVTATPEPLAPAALVQWDFGAENEAKPGLGGRTWEEWWEGVFADFNQEYPDITFELRKVGYSAGGTTLFLDTALAAGDPPDIMRDWAGRMVKYAGQGLLEDLSDSVAGFEDKFAVGALEASTSGMTGEVWGIPHGTTPIFMMINKTLFEQAGCLDTVPPPEGDREWTTDQFMAAMECVNDPANQVYGTLLFSKTPSGDYLNIPYLLGHGAQMYASPNTCQETIINSPEGVAGLQFTIDLVDGGYAVPGPPGLTDDDQWAYWQRKELAVIGAYPYHKTLAQLAIDQGLTEAPFDVYYVNFPHQEGAPNPPNALQAQQVFSILKAPGRDPNRVEAAKVFLRWLVEHDEYIKEYVVGQELPISPIASHGSLDPDDADLAWVMDQIERDGVADLGYGCGKFPEVRSLWAEAMQAAWSGGADAQVVLDDYVAKANAALQSP